MDLSVVVPIYNEEETLPELYKRIRQTVEQLQVEYEILFVNDGSQDRSIGIIKDFAKEDSHVKYINFSRNFGHQVAIYAGIEKASGQAIVSIDGDLQDPPELIEKLYQKYKRGYEVVYAQRQSRQGRGPLKRVLYKLFYRLLARITKVEIPLDTGDFRLIDEKVATELQKMREQEKFLRGQIAWLGFSQIHIRYNREARAKGEAGYTYRKLFKLAIDGITAFSTFPLKLATLSGFMASAIAFLLMAWVIFAKFYNPQYDIQGWYSLMVSVLFVGGVQLITIGIIGEYISRISDNVRRRPLYIIQDTNIEQRD